MPPAPTTSNFAFCTIAKRSWKFMTHEAPGDPDESCVFLLFRLLFFGGGKGVNCEPIHDYNYGYSFNFLLPVCKQDWTNKTTTPPKRIYLTKNQHLHQHISTLLSTILTIEYHFQFGETYLQNKECICKKNINKTHCFLPRVSNRSMGFPTRPTLAETHPPRARTAPHPRQPSQPHPRQPPRHWGPSWPQVTSQWVLYQAGGETNPFSEWLFTYFLFWGDFFLTSNFFFPLQEF